MWCSARSERGIALLIVVSVLAVIGIMGVAFAFSMYLETQAAHQFVFANQARYLAEGGVAHARALLDEDRLGTRVDELTEAWSQGMAGADADVDGDRVLEAKWWTVSDASGQPAGRYALHITDETGKVNLNIAQASPSLLELGGLNLTALLQQVQIDNAAAAAEAVESYRYGPDARPGKAGVDDDGDGAIDELDEYQPLALRGDDRRLEGVEELVTIAELTTDQVRRLSRDATVYSWDMNVSVAGQPRVNVNTATAAELVSVLLDAGVEDPWQAAANMADAADADVEMSRVMKAVQTVSIADQGSLGGWTWTLEPQAHYESVAPGEAHLTWSAPVPTGTFRVRVRGLQGVRVGDVTVAGRLQPSMDDGESLGIFELDGSLALDIDNRESVGTTCAFRGIELVSDQAVSGVPVRGIEAVRFNELMVDPTMDVLVSAATFDSQGSDWSCQAGADLCVNGGVGQARWTWTGATVPPSRRYHVRVLSSTDGQTVGEVSIDGDTQLLIHEQRHPSTLLVGADGKISLTIGKTNPEETYYLKGIRLSVQPDAEYAELINLSGESIDLGGWTIEGDLTGGQQARFPSGSVIAPHGVLVAAVDLADTQGGLAGNHIDARSSWEMTNAATAVQLEFPSGGLSADDDWLKSAVPSGGVARVALRRGDVTVDEVQYLLPPSPGFQSLEKGDPTAVVDANQDGIDEGWHPSLQLYTPGAANDNDGLREQVGSETITHDPSQEITVPNRPLEGVGELAGLASGEAWKPFSSTELAKFVDRLTVDGLRLEAEGHWSGTSGQEAWVEQAEGYVHTDSAKAGVAGQWRWTGLLDGSYRLSLYSCEGCAGEEMAVRWQEADGSYSTWSPALSTDAQGRIVIGQVTVGEQALTLEVTCQAPSGVCHVDHAELDPRLIRVGPINVNTASREVLLTLSGVTEAIADRIISGRPYGDQGHKGRGIGDLLQGEVLGSDEEEQLETFRQLGHLVTTRSEVFEILSLGQAGREAHVNATQRIQTIVQRAVVSETSE